MPSSKYSFTRNFGGANQGEVKYDCRDPTGVSNILLKFIVDNDPTQYYDYPDITFGCKCKLDVAFVGFVDNDNPVMDGAST